MIISASRRTDIPGFYSEWFMNRLRAGYCVVPNPYNPKQLTKPVSLKVDDVDCIVFWTRNAKPMLKHLDELDDKVYNYYFLYTINAYPKDLEPFSPKRDQAIDTFIELSQRLGTNRVIWRYDPIIYTNKSDYSWHCDNISYIANRLKGHTNKMIFSFVDPYRKTINRLKKESPEISFDENAFEPRTYVDLLEFMGKNAPAWNLEIAACAEENDFEKYGINQSKCIDAKLIEEISNKPLKYNKDKGQREHCLCTKSRDIGVNNTCLFGCSYCYATLSHQKAITNNKSHNPASESI